MPYASMGRSFPTAETIPFTRSNLKRAFAQLAIAHLDVSKKSVDNTLSELNGIADVLGMPTGYALTALNSECQAIQDRLVTQEDRGSCIRLLRVVSCHGIPITQVADAVPLLRAQIEADWKVERKDREFKRALYAWNKAVKLFPDLDLRPIEVPKTLKVWGLRWRDQLAMLEPSVDEHLALGDPKPEGETSLPDLQCGRSAPGARRAVRKRCAWRLRLCVTRKSTIRSSDMSATSACRSATKRRCAFWPRGPAA